MKTFLVLLRYYSKNTHVIAITSAGILSAAFFFPRSLFWLTFIFLIPLFYSTYKNSACMGFTQGFLWGTFYFTTHFMALIQGIIVHGHGWIRFIAPVVLVVYCALYSGLWFFIAQYISRLKQDSLCFIFSTWIATTFFYSYWMRYYAFWVLEWSAGYCLAYPLIPLAQYIQSLYLLKYLSEELLLLWLIIVNAYLAYVYIQKKVVYALFFPFFLMPFIIGFFLPHKQEIPRYLNKVGWVAPPEIRLCPLATAQEITYRLQNLFKRYPNLQYIILPESSFPFSLNQHRFAIDMWFDHAVPETVTIIIGSHSCIDKKVLNSAFYLRVRRIIQKYDKVNLMPYTENFIDNKIGQLLNKLFITDTFYFNRGNNKMELIPFIIFNDLIYPQICSDLLWKKSDIKNKYILWLVNDKWVFMQYMQHLLYLFARYQSLVKNSNILYISHTKGVFISLNGKVVTIAH